MGPRRRNALLLSALALACFAATVYLVFSREDLWFWLLRLHRKNQEYAQQYAQKLSSTKRGIDLALRDFGVFGGKTRGWSSWILLFSPHQEYVVGRLKGIVADENTDLDRRLEALLILWERTRDDSYLIVCFQAVQNPGPPLVFLVRGRLASAVGCKALQVPASERMPIDLEEFKSLLSEAHTSER